MEKCPKCGHWTLELSFNEKLLKCYMIGCDYQKTIDVDSYLQQQNVLPLLIESLRLNGYQ